MLEHIFSSVARTKILKFFCVHQFDKFFIREIARRLNLQLNSARRELDNLEYFGFLDSVTENGKKYYFVNQEFSLLPEIKNLIFKASALEEVSIAEKMSKISGLKLLVFTGILTKSQAQTDVLIVGKVAKSEFEKYLHKIAEGLPQELRCTFMTLPEYQYRLEITDKFIYDIWAFDHLVVVDKTKNGPVEDFSFKHFKQ